MEELFCTGCQRNRPESEFHRRSPATTSGRQFSYSCKDCKRDNRNRDDEQWSDLYRRYGVVCPECGVPAGLTPDGICRRCLARKGFRYCSRCTEKKLLFLEFYSRRSECIACSPDRALEQYVQCHACKCWHGKDTQCKQDARAKKRPRRCCRCTLMKEAEEFYSTRVCNSCSAAQEQERCAYLRSPEATEREAEKERCGKLSRSERHRDGYLRAKYGINFNQYLELVRAQNGLCYICGRTNTKGLAVDHDHRTSRMRKLLCDNCNLGLGNFQDAPDLLRKAAEYLEAHR